MVLPLIALLAAGPAQGYAVAVEPFERVGTTEAEAKLVESGIREELKAQGYGVTDSRTAKGTRAVMSGRLVRKDGKLIVELTLARTDTGQVLDNDRKKVDKTEELTDAGKELAKSLAREMRMTFGVRAIIKM